MYKTFYKVFIKPVTSVSRSRINQSHLDKVEVFRVNLLSPKSDRNENDDGSVVSDRSLRGCMYVHLH